VFAGNRALRKRKWQEDGDSYIMKRVIVLVLRQMNVIIVSK
jgi:hypothetical protein